MSFPKETVAPDKFADRAADSPLKKWTAPFFYRTHDDIADVPIPENVGDFRLEAVACRAGGHHQLFDPAAARLELSRRFSGVLRPDAVLVNGRRPDDRLARELATGTPLCATYAVNSPWTLQANKAR
jgi:hypothetical protein